MRRGEIRWHAFAPPNKRRPVLLLTRDDVIDRLNEVIVVPVTRTIRGISTEVPVGVAITFEASGTRLYTMLCDPTSCQLYSGTYDFYADAATDGELTPVPGGELAGAPTIRGLATRGMDGTQVWVLATSSTSSS